MPKNETKDASKHLITGSVLAVVIAAIILVVFVLPAEFGKDITGIGEKIGIKGMSIEQQEGPAVVLSPSTDTVAQSAYFEQDSDALHIEFSEPIQFMEFDFVLEPYGQAEYKFDMQQGQGVSYGWSVQGGLAYADLHGHTPDPSGEGEILVSYLESDTVTGASGAFITPFSGEHGWYFLNLETTEIKVKVRASGHWNARELIELPSQL